MKKLAALRGNNLHLLPGAEIQNTSYDYFINNSVRCCDLAFALLELSIHHTIIMTILSLQMFKFPYFSSTSGLPCLCVCRVQRLFLTLETPQSI